MGLELICVEISMVVGIFVGEILGVSDYVIGVGGSGLEVARRVGIGGVLVGRAWVSSLPNFFLGNSFQFWKPPPYLCINSMDNVYYPIFSGCYIVIITNIEYAVLCIISGCLSVKMVSQTRRFRLW